MKKIYLGLSVIALVCVFLLSSGSVLALRTDNSNSCASTDDRDIFPYSFLCGTSQYWTSPMRITISNLTQGGSVGDGDTITGGDVVRITGTWTDPNGHYPKRDGGAGANELLAFITLNTQSNTTYNGIHAQNLNGGSYNYACPGDSGGSAPDGKYVPGKIWGDRDIGTQDYSRSAIANGNDASPVAYNPTTGNGIINCGGDGQMVYWKDSNTNRSSASYSFDLRTDTGFDASNICTRFDLSVRFSGDSTQYFPQSKNNTVPPGGGGVNDPNILFPNNNSKITATHLVKQSENLCFNIEKPPQPPVRTVGCERYTNDNLTDHSIYRYSYFPVDEPHVTGGPANGTVVPTNRGGWESFNSAPVYQTPSSGSGVLNTNQNFNDGRTIFDATTDDVTVNFPNPSGPDRLLYVEYWRHIDTNGNGTLDSWRYSGGEASHAAERDCYVATCSVSTPSARVNAGQQFYAFVTITNSGTKQFLPGSINSSNLSFIGTGQWTGVLANFSYINPGQSRTVRVSLTAPSAAGNYSLGGYPAYNGLFNLYGTRGGGGSTYGGACPGAVTIGVSLPFTLTPRADSPGGSVEQPPPTIAYQTGIVNSIAQQVNVGTYSTFTDSNGTVRAIFNGTAGPVGPSETLVLSGSIPTISPIRAGDTYCSYIRIDHNKGVLGPGGPSDITWDDSVNPGDPPKEDTKCLTVHNKPYFRVRGTGVSAGGDFAGTSCQSAGKGILGAWNNNTGATPNTSGGVTDYSALALLTNTGFGTGINQSIAPPSAAIPVPKFGASLSFANNGLGVPITTSHADSPSLGGNFAANHCIKKLKQPPNNALPTIAGNTKAAPLSSIPTGKYTHTGNLIFDNNNMPPPAVKNLEIFIDGDVSITDNIRYTGGGMAGNASSFVLHVTGNIYIDPGVTELDGYYAAEGNGTTTGKIYTCANGYTPMTQTNIYGCNRQLHIYGAFAANEINLMRAYGSLRNAPNPAAGCSNAGSGPNPVSCGAEVFQFTPELYLSAPAGGATSSWGKFDSIRSLPPVL